MTGVKRREKVKNWEIRNLTKIKDCRIVIKKLKYDYVGHVARSVMDHWERKILEWVPKETKRKVGRPKTRWEGEIIQ